MKNKRPFPRKSISLSFLIVGLLVAAVSFPLVSGLMRLREKSSSEAMLLPPSLSATKTGTLDTTAGGDLNGNNVINPGDRLTYNVTINNNGADAATGVNFSDVIDANTTEVANSLIVSPIAVNDGYSTIGNVGITVPDGASDLLANDLNPNVSGTLTIQSPPTTSANGGAVSINTTTGAFTYNPPAGFEGTDTFSYTLSNGTGLTDTATVSINVSGMIWFVNNNVGACSASCNGRLSNPFTTLSAFQSVNNGTGSNPAAGDNVFIYSSATGYDASVTLLNNQKLIGQGALATLASIAGVTVQTFSNALPSTGGTNPTIINTTAGTTVASNAVNLGSGNTIRGLTIGNTTGAKLNATASVGTLTIGPASGTSDVTLNGNGQAMNLTGGGILAARFASVSSTNANQAATTTAITLTGLSGSLVSPTTTITNPNGAGINISNSVSNATFDFGNSQVNQSGGTAVNLSNNTASFAFAGLDIAPDSGQRAFHSTNGTGAITTTSGTISTTNNTAIEITQSAGTTPLNVQLTSVSANGGTNGIVLTNTSSSNSPGGFRILGNGGTCTSAATCTGGTIQSSTGHGVSLTSARNVSFDRTNIQNTAGSGVDGTSVVNFSFTNGVINNSGTGGGLETSNIAFNDGVTFQENNVSGTVTITGNTLSNPHYHGVDIFNWAGLLDYANVSGNTITAKSGGAHSLGSAIRLIARGASVTSASVTRANLDNNTVQNGWQAVGIQAQGGHTGTAPAVTFGVAGNATNVISISGNTLTAPLADPFNVEGIIAVHNHAGQANFKINNNGTAALPIGKTKGTAISNSAFGNVTVTSEIKNNYIAPSNIVGSQGIGVGTSSSIPIASGGNLQTPNLTVAIENNVISQTDGAGILAVAIDASGLLKIAIKNNNVGARASSGGQSLVVRAGGTNGDNDVCLDISGNTSAPPVGAPEFLGIGLRKQGTSPTVNAFGIKGMSATATPGVENYVNGLNPNGGGTLLVSASSGFTNCSSSPFAEPASEVENNTIDNFDTSQSFLNRFYQKTSNLFTSGSSTSDIITQKEKIVSMPAAEEKALKMPVETDISGEFAVIKRIRFGFNEGADKIAATAQKSLSAFESLFVTTVAAEENTNNSKALLSGETITKSIGTIPAGESVTIQFKVTVDANIPSNDFSVANTAQISATNHGTINSSTATTTVVQPASIAKAFGAARVALNGTTTLTFTVANGNASILNNVSFTDPLPSGLVVADTPGVVNNCLNGTVTAVAGASTISYSGGIRAANTSCTIVVNVKGTTEGAKDNVTNAVTSTEGGTGNTASASLSVINPPIVSTSFTPDKIGVNSTSQLAVSIQNTNTTQSLTGVSLTDALPAGVTAPDSSSAQCGGTLSIASNVISLTGATVAASSTCTVNVTVTGATVGVKNNSVTVNTGNAGTGFTANATLTVSAPPTISKSFSPATILLNSQTSTLTLTITNPAGNPIALTGVGVTDAFPAGMEVDQTPASTNSCATGTFSPTAGATSISVSNATIPLNTSCTFTVKVKGTTVGAKTNTTGNVSSSNAGNGLTASATLTVTNTLTWTGATSTNWHTASNWNLSAVPSATNDVVLPAGALTNEPTISSSDVTVSNLTINTGRTLTIGSGRNLTVTNAFVNNGTLNNAGTFTAGTITGNGTVNFTATTAQTIPSGTYSNLTINNPAGVSISGDTTITGALTLTNGILNTVAHTLTLSGTASSTRSGTCTPATCFIASNAGGGGVFKQFPAGSTPSFTFPIGTTGGTDNGYTPVSLANITAAAAGDGLTVRAVDSVSPAAINSPSITRFWQLTETGSIVTDLTFSYLTGDTGSITDPTRLRIFRDAANVCSSDCVNETGFTATVSGISAFSPWTIAQQAVPTSASVTIGGRVLSPEGRGISKARVMMTNANGEVRYAMTNPFGFYRFTDVQAGATYSFALEHKRFEFEPQIITINEETGNLNFTGQALNQ